MKKKLILLSSALLIIVILMLFSRFIGYYGDWLWFRSLGYGSVFTTILWTKIVLFILFFLVFAAFAWLNIAIARKRGSYTRSLKVPFADRPVRTSDIIFSDRFAKYTWAAIILFLSFIMGSQASGTWETFLKFLHASKFGIADPIFSKDAGFYVFRLPLYNFLQGWYLFSVVVISLAVLTSYFMDQAVGVQGNRFFLNQKARSHLAVLGGLIFLGIALVYRLNLYSLMYSTSGVAYGASYVDVHAQIPAYWAVMVTALIVAILFFLVPFTSKWKFVLYSIGLFFAVLIGFSWIYPSLIEQYVVKPNQLTMETPYILNNIKFTRLGFGLNKVEEKHFPVGPPMTYADLEANDSTIHNIRLWDTRPLLDTYRQLQEIRLYYNFKNVQVDRYHLDGKYTEVAVAARELPVSQLPARARTWINLHLKYTHGYGVVMSPVNEITKNGMPNLIVKNIPPTSGA